MKNPQRFELLSAYLDQELSAEEIKKVDRWLIYDPEAQRTYKNLLQLRYYLRESPVPASHPSREKLTEKVVTQANNNTWRQVLFWSGGSLVALLITIMSGIFSWTNSSLPRLANSKESDVPSDSLMIAVDEPIVEMPIVPVSSSSQKQQAWDSLPQSEE